MSLQFWRSKEFSDESFLDLITRTFGVSFTGTTEARTWLSNNGYFTSYPDVVDDGLVLNLDAQNLSSFRGEPTTNLSPISYEKTGSNEYLPYCSIVEIFDTYGTDGYYVSFEAKSPVPGQVNMYTSDTTSRKYTFTSQPFQITNNFEKYSLPITNIYIYDAAQTINRLSFYGTYGTGRIVTVKNLQIEQKTHSTQFVDGTRGATVATGGGWVDLTGNGYNVSLINSPSQVYNNNFISFDGLTNYCQFDSAYTFSTGNGVDYTFEIWFKMRTLPTVQYGSNGHIWGGQNGNNVVLYLNPESGGVSKGIMVYDDSRYYPDMMTNGGFTADTWAQWVIVGDGTNNTVTHYINGNLDKENGVVMTGQEVRGWAGTHIAYDTRWLTYSELDISIMRQYNRKLTAIEVLSNFNTEKIKFGL